MKNVFFPLIFSIIMLSISACGPSYIFDNDKEIANKTWLYKDSINFYVPIEDISSTYNVILSVTHDEEFGNENAYVNVFVKSPDGKRTKNQVSVEMADKAGQWRGRCSGGSCVLETMLQESAKFPQKGNYTFTIIQNNRMDSLQLVEKIGLKLQKQAKEN